MKKKLVLMLTVMTIVGTFVTGCSGADVKKEVENIEEEVKADGGEFVAKVEEDVKKIEEATVADIEKGEKDIKTIEEETHAGLEKIKEVIEKDADEAKDEALKLFSESEERINGLFEGN